MSFPAAETKIRLGSLTTTSIVERTAVTSPRVIARTTGVFYLVTMLAGIFAQGFIGNRLIVYTDAAATANNIQAHATLFQSAFTVYLLEMACQIVTTALFYRLLKPAGANVSFVAAFLGLAGCTIKTMSRLFYIAPVFLVGSAPQLSAFSPDQLKALALVFLKVNDQGAAIALVFFGFYALLNGYLILRSTFLPRFLGIWSMIGGLGWLAFLYPPAGYALFPYVAAVALLGALALIVWLLVFGVNEQRWIEQATV